MKTKLFSVPVSKFSFLLLIGCVSFVFISSADATPIWATGVSESSGWFDAEKTNTTPDDDMGCWAATAANILSWSGWDAGYANEDDIYSFFTAEDPISGTTGGWMNYAWNFWFDGSELGGHYTGSSHTGYYTTQEYTDNYVGKMNTTNAMVDAEDLLTNDYGIGLGVFGDNMAHAITLWGIDKNDQDEYVGVWVTDSDNEKGGPHDRPNTLNYHEIDWVNNHWHLQDFYNSDGHYIDHMQALGHSVPEPSTITLLIFGLLGLSCMRRRKRK